MVDLTRLETEELLRHAYMQHNALTTTDMERELARRLENGERTNDDIDRVLSDFGVDDPEDRPHVAQLRRALQWETDWDPQIYEPLLEALSAAGIDDAKQLTRLLDRLDELEAAIEDGQLAWVQPEDDTPATNL